MEQRELPLRGDLENRAVTALDAAVAVVAAVVCCAVKVAVGCLEQRRLGCRSVHAVEGVQNSDRGGRCAAEFCCCGQQNRIEDVLHGFNSLCGGGPLQYASCLSLHQLYAQEQGNFAGK